MREGPRNVLLYQGIQIGPVLHFFEDHEEMRTYPQLIPYKCNPAMTTHWNRDSVHYIDFKLFIHSICAWGLFFNYRDVSFEPEIYNFLIVLGGEIVQVDRGREGDSVFDGTSLSNTRVSAAHLICLNYSLSINCSRDVISFVFTVGSHEIRLMLDI